jgi:protein SCO1
MRRSLIAFVAALGLAACSPSEPAWRTKSVTGLLPDLAFSLREAGGREVTAADYRGRVVLLFFGYASCPDVCPTTLARLAAARHAMHAQGDPVRVLFVTVDPARDTPAKLAAYASAFGPGVLGLRGEDPALQELTRRYRVSYTREAPDAHGNYEVSHSAGVFVFDRAGHARLLVRPDDAAADIAADLDRLASEAVPGVH